jgi:hypothetical protein
LERVDAPFEREVHPVGSREVGERLGAGTRLAAEA